MAALLMVSCGSSGQASAYAAEAASGTLWDVSLGTTTKVTTCSDCLGVECTPTRAQNLLNAAPEGTQPLLYSSFTPFDNLDTQARMCWLAGKLDGI